MLSVVVVTKSMKILKCQQLGKAVKSESMTQYFSFILRPVLSHCTSMNSKDTEELQ